MDEQDDVAAAPQRDWASIRAAYESGEGTIASICERFDVTKGALEHRSEIDRWVPRNARHANFRSVLLGRMFTVLDKQVQQLAKDDMEKGIDKQAALLGTMAKTLEKLMELDRLDRGNAPKQKKDMRELRERLVRRIDELRQG